MKSLGDLSGKIIIDPTNPTRQGEDGLVEHVVQTSNAEMIQALAPRAHIVKAFNTLSAQTMTDPKSAGGPITIPLVGNNAEAKATVAGSCAASASRPRILDPYATRTSSKACSSSGSTRVSPDGHSTTTFARRLERN